MVIMFKKAIDNNNNDDTNNNNNNNNNNNTNNNNNLICKVPKEATETPSFSHCDNQFLKAIS